MRNVELGRLGYSAYKLRKSEDGEAREEALKGVISRMASMKGLPQKFGQILSLSDLSGEDYKPLTESHDLALPSSDTFPWIAEQLGQPLTEVFESIEDQGIAASLGQVHRGILKDGREVAVKIQYPSVRQHLESDLGSLFSLAGAISQQRSGFSLDAYRAELRDSLLHELNYFEEHKTLERFSRLTAVHDEFVVPRVCPEYTTEQLIVMDWIEGKSFQAVLDWSEHEKLQTARALLRLFLMSWLVWGEVHGDPHSGNIRFSKDANGRVVIGLLDFGCTKKLTEQEMWGLRSLLVLDESSNPDDHLCAYRDIGFDADLLEPMKAKLPGVTRLLCQPFSHKGVFTLDSWNLSESFASLLGDDRMNFRFAGPPALIHFIRAFSGTIAYIRALGCDLNWGLELHHVLKNVQQEDAPKPVPHKVEPVQDEYSGVSDHLKIQVFELGFKKVELSFPARVVERIEEIIPVDILEKLVENNYELDEIVEKSRGADFSPGELFTLEEGPKTVRVWLE